MTSSPSMARSVSCQASSWHCAGYRSSSGYAPAGCADVEFPTCRSTNLQPPTGSHPMKVLVFVKATPKSEKGLVVDEQTKQMFADMGQFNEQLVKAGLIQDADGLKPSSFGKRVHFSGQHVSVVDGPFAETKELVAGYWIWNVK